MRALETAAGLEEFERRGAGTNAERRAAHWLSGQLSTSSRDVLVEPFWCRPSWPMAHLWHVGLALAGSLVSVASPIAGTAMLAVALVSIVADALTGISLGRRLTAERASQNVVAVPRTAPQNPVHLIVTANYDAGRAGVAYRGSFRRVTSALRRATLGLSPGWLGWLSLTILGLLALAILRIDGHTSKLIGVIQLPPTIVLVLAVALLLELATADPGPAAGDNGSGVGVAIELVRALDAAAPGNVSVELVLQGAGEDAGIGLRKYLRARRTELTPINTIVLGIAACSAGTPRWWVSDGPFVPLRYSRLLATRCKEIAAQEPTLGVSSHPGRGSAPALAARILRRPSISIGCLDEHEIVPHSHERDDTVGTIETSALDAAVQFGLMLVDEIDAWLAVNRPQEAVTPA